MKCRKCQFDNATGMKFCVECGTKLEMVCPKCNASNSPDHKLCGECGHRVNWPEHCRPPKVVSFDEKLAKIQKCLPSSLAEILLNLEREQSLGAEKWIEETAQCFFAAEAMIYMLRCSREEEMKHRQKDNFVEGNTSRLNAALDAS
jgi:hypothetical protein